MKLIVQKTDKLDGTITVPGSKSHSVRALLFASLAEMETGEKSTITNLLESDDTNAAQGACKALLNGENKIYTGNSGITTRFIMPMLGLRKNAEESVILHVDEQMKARPIQPLIDALQNLGMLIEPANSDGTFPYRIWGSLEGGETEVDGSTSQYISALFMSLPAAKKDSVIRVHNLKERSYMEMMLAWLDELGIKYEHKYEGGTDTFKIPGQQVYKAFTKQIPGDFSSASYPLAAAALLNGEVTLQGLNMEDQQGDKEMVKILQEMGAEISIDRNEIIIRGAKPLKGIEVDANLIPDMLPTLAVLGTQAEGETKIHNVAHARIKETDRIHSMAEGLRAMGADIEEMEDGLIVRKSKLHGVKVQGYEDHRTIMALSLAGMLADGETVVDTAEGINKTFPSYVELMASLGAKMQLKQDHIVIIGFKHAGKTTIGKRLASALDLPFIDLDNEIEKYTDGKTCREFMDENGEETFRDLESKILKKVVKNKRSVIATGGGAPMRKENQDLIKQELCIHTEVEIEELLRRIEKGGWPAFVDKSKPRRHLRKLLEERMPVYKELAKITLDNTGSKDESLENLKVKLAKYLQLNVIIGHPLDHTWTPRLHNAAYSKLGMNALMLANPCEDADEFFKNILNWPVSMTVVTMPHKETIMKHLDEISEDGKAIGAVNTVINKNDRLTGYNTDIDGIAYALRDEQIQGQKILLLGAGGAAKAAAYFINREGGDLYCLNRSREKAEDLMRAYGGQAIDREKLSQHEFALIINATPLGMHEHTDKSPLEQEDLRGTETVFDMIYNPAETLLLQIAKKAACKTVSGLDMFVAQGLKQIELLTGKTLDPNLFIKLIS